MYRCSVNPMAILTSTCRTRCEIEGFGLDLVAAMSGKSSRSMAASMGAGAGIGAFANLARLSRAMNRMWHAKIGRGHAWTKHKIETDEFPEIESPLKLSEHIDDVVLNGISKQLKWGRTAHLDLDSGTIVIRDPGHVDGGTAFRPWLSKKGPRDPLEVFNELE